MVRPEILDRLDAASPAARASHRDLRLINRLQGSRAWIGCQLKERHRRGEGVLEVGAGAGDLGRALGALVPALAGLDRGPRPRHWPPTARWFRTDLLDFSGWEQFPVVIGNLFFHHFDGKQLDRLGARINRHARVIIANDPLRARRTERLFALLCPLVRAHPVTRHDGRVSIAAGFRHDELPRLLGLEPDRWAWRTSETWHGACRLVAVRRS